MINEFLAIIDRHPSGTYSGYVPELPGVRTGGWSLEEVRAALIEMVRLTLEFERSEALVIAGAESIREIIRVESGPAECSTARSSVAPVPAAQRTRTEEAADLLRQLQAEGLIGEVQMPADEDDFDPLPIEDRPISGEFIEGRR